MCAGRSHLRIMAGEVEPPPAETCEFCRLLALIDAAAAAAEKLRLDQIFIALRYTHADAIELAATHEHAWTCLKSDPFRNSKRHSIGSDRR